MDLEAIVGFLNLVEGERKEGAPPGLVVEMPPARPARGRGRDMLFIHLCLTSRDTASQNLFRELIDTFSNAFYQSSGSVTAAMRHAVRAANEYLMRHNLRAQGVSKQQGALTCAVLREEEMFIAQAGPALGFVIHQGRLERLPSRRLGHVTPLGIGYGVDTRFYHSWVQPGDVLLLADATLEDQEDTTIGSAVIYEGVEAGLTNLANLVPQGGQARLMLVELAAAAEPVDQQPPIVEKEPEIAATELPPPSPPAEPKPSLEIDVGREVHKATSSAVMGFARLVGGIGKMLESLFGSPPPRGQAVRKNQGLPPATMGLMAILIPILVAVTAVAVYHQRGRAERFQDLLQQLSQESKLAQEAVGDEPGERAHWDQVIVLTDEALQLHPAHEGVLDFRQQAFDRLDMLDEITRLSVSSLYRYKGGGLPKALVEQSLSLYVLDTSVNQLYRHLLQDGDRLVQGEKPETLIFGAQVVGSEVVGELVDLVWVPQSGEITDDTVTVLDSTGLLLRYHPFGAEAEEVHSYRLTLPPEWSNPAAVAIYGDSFYVLDIGAARVWKYKTRQGVYPDEPEAYAFDPTDNLDISQMIDMAIDREGNLYLLGGDGVVHKFFDGQRQYFSLDELKEPLVAPSAIYCSLTGLNPLFYIADPDSGRIIQTTQQGLVIAQYRAQGADLADPFTEVTDIFVQENKYIYATSGETLIVASLD